MVQSCNDQDQFSQDSSPFIKYLKKGFRQEGSLRYERATFRKAIMIKICIAVIKIIISYTSVYVSESFSHISLSLKSGNLSFHHVDFGPKRRQLEWTATRAL